MSLKLKNHGCDVVIRYIDTHDTPNPQQLQTWSDWLDSSEQARLQRFQRPEHRQRYLISHALLRGVLAEQAQCAPAELGFGALSHGKPILNHPQQASELHFNLSHTQGLAAIAVSHKPVGLDLEWLARRGPDVALAERYFTATEYQDILSQPLAQQHRRLLCYWTLKEAYIKAEGWGLRVPLDSFEFALNGQQHPQLRILQPQAQPRHEWQFRQFETGSNHLLALATVATPDHALRIDCAAWQPAQT